MLTRRALLGAVSATALASSALAQPVGTQLGPVAGPSGPGGRGYGPQPLGVPSLDLNFLSGALDPRITFTRAAGPATYFDATGTMQTAGTNVPRFDYDPVTLAPRGLLIEEARTNSIRNSTMAGAAAGTPGTLPTNWGAASLAGLTQTVVGTGTESGITYIDIRFNGTSTGTSLNVPMETITATAALQNQVWTESFYYRLVGGTLTNVTNINAEVFVYTSAPAFLNAFVLAQTNASSAALVWRRAVGTFTLTDATTATIRPLVQWTIANGAAIDFTIRIGAPQLELGAFATSYIPTTGAAATRAADVATTPIGPWFNAAAGTLAVEFNVPQLSVFNPAYAQLDDGTNNNMIGLRSPGNTGLSGFVFIAGVNKVTDGAAGAITPGAISKAAFSYVPATMNATLNGASPNSGAITGGALPTVTTLRLGSGRFDPVNGYLRRVSYWPRALAAQELQIATLPDGPSLELDFTIALDPRVTFTRAAGPATYFDATGTLQTAGTNVARFDYDPVTHAAKGLLVEEARTNLLLNGTTLSDWTPTTATATAASIASPSGVVNGVKLTEDATASTDHYTTLTFPSIVGNTTYVGTAFFKAATRTQVYVAFRVAGAWTGGNAVVVADLSLGTILSSAGAVSSSIQAVGNGWYRVSVTATTVASPATPQMRIGLAVAGNSTYSGDGASFAYIWGADLQVGAFATSYIPTTGASATRAVDVANIPVGPWFNNAAMSMAVEAMGAQAATSANARVAQIDNGTNSTPVAVYVASAGVIQSQLGAAFPALGNYTAGVPWKASVAATAAAGAASFNGAAPATGVPGTLPTYTTLRFGNIPSNAAAWNGYIRRVRYWPRALSNAELQQWAT